MSLFESTVNEAITHSPDISPLKIVVEKEILHHDILRILNENGLLKNLTFIGGTCLRACYGGIRLSEDLDFTGGKEFNRKSLSQMADVLTEKIYQKYNLPIFVTEPKKDIKNVDTWKIKIETRPEQKHIPAQRINIDICAVPSYEKQPTFLINHYNIDLGTNGLIIQAQTLEEIYTDKLLAFALRPNRVKYRDLWDVIWMHQNGKIPHLDLIEPKLNDRNIKFNNFKDLYVNRCHQIEDEKYFIEFKKEMSRFLPPTKINSLIEQDGFWILLVNLIKGFSVRF